MAAVAPVAVFWLLGVRMQRIDNKRTSFIRAVGFYERAMLRMKGDWAGDGEIGERFSRKQPPIREKDLDVFGRRSLVLAMLCAARTPMGQETLAAWLLKPAAADVVRARQGAVAELAPQLEPA